ncbi:MAG: hypothetical protein OHK0039_17310 [Bacteroidia bacterium]
MLVNRIVIFCLFLSQLLILPAVAQPYALSIGGRAGSANGIAVKTFLGRSQTAVEAIAAYRHGGAQVIATVQQQMELGYRSDFYLFLGAGGHAGYKGIFERETADRLCWGVDAIIGVEYVFPGSPFAISFDFKPLLELHQGVAISGNNAGVTLRCLID